MEIKRKIINVSLLRQNSGQIAGLPKNPRTWTSKELENLCESIQETPELLNARPPIVVKKEKIYVAVGGNMRVAAIKKLGWSECPCYVIDADDVEKLKQIAIKDNSSFGEWDYDELANKWDDLPLTLWGVDFGGHEQELPDFENKEIDVGSFTDYITMTFKFNQKEFETVSDFFYGKDARTEILKKLNYEV